MSEDCQKCGTAMYELDEDRNCPGCSDRAVPPAGDVEVLELDNLADIPYANETPHEWDADYRKIWQELQVASRHKAQLRAHVIRLTAERDGLTIKAEENNGARPSLGDVEVLGRDIYDAMGGEYAEAWRACHDALTPRITRLTAERGMWLRAHNVVVAEHDGLLAEVEQWRASNKANALAAGELVAGLQSELTKARELLRGVHTGELFGPEDWKMVSAFLNQSAPAAKMCDCNQGRLPCTCNIDESCGQDAEAAKGGFGKHVPRSSERSNRIYVAGPMTGIEGYNFPAFNAAAAMLRGKGWEVENPAEHQLSDELNWADYMAYDLTRLGLCGAIYLLPGWSKSKGACIEKCIADSLGMQIQLADGSELTP